MVKTVKRNFKYKYRNYLKMKKTITILLSIFTLFTVQAQGTKFNLVVGTYNRTCESKGIYVYEFDATTGDFKLKYNTENVLNTSYLTVSKDAKFVYAVNQNSGANESGVSAFAYTKSSGKLDFLNRQSVADGPCYIINDDMNVITANYTSGTISVFGKQAEGTILPSKQVLQHQGKGINAKRQEAPHAHMVCFSPDHKFVLATDLGTDKVYSYQYNPNSEKEVLVLKDTMVVKAGSGPRHFIFGNDGKYVYLLQELDGTLTSYSYAKGKLTKVSETTVIPKDFVGEIGAADIHISPDGKFLYATNRGTANDITTFKVLKEGKLEHVAQTSTLGKGPRNFAIDPTGKFVLIGHQFSDEIVIFKRDIKTGMLTPTGKKIDICSPVCLVFTKAE